MTAAMEAPTVERTRHVAYGYTPGSGGERERAVREAWTKEDALAELLERRKEITAGKVERSPRNSSSCRHSGVAVPQG